MVIGAAGLGVIDIFEDGEAHSSAGRTKEAGAREGSDKTMARQLRRTCNQISTHGQELSTCKDN